MSKDLLKTAAANITSATFNDITLKGENIGKSIRPELVSRVSLHPTIVDGELEKRVFYTLHNDAGDCVYVSERMRTQETDDDTLSSIIIPGNPNDDMIAPPNYPVPPIPPVYIPEEAPADDDYKWPDSFIPKTIKKTDEETDIDEYEEGGGSGLGGGYSGGGDGDVFIPDKPRTDFDNYAAKLVSGTWSGYKPGINFGGDTHNVTKFYEVTYSATTAVSAMADTRDEYKQMGMNVTRAFPNLITGTSMYARAAIYTFYASYPKLVEADEMFTGCDLLKSVSFSGNGVTKLESANDMFWKCTSLKTANLGSTYRLTRSSYTFGGCSSLKTVRLNLSNLQDGTGFFYNCSSLESLTNAVSNLKSLTTGDYMFYGCSSLKTLPSFDTSLLSSARGMFQNCTKLPITTAGGYYKLIDGSRMFAGCTQINRVSLDMPLLTNATQMFSGCPITSIYGDVNLNSLRYANGFLGAARLSLADADKVLSSVSVLDSMPAMNGDVNNGFHLGIASSEATGDAWNEFASSWGYNEELGLCELGNGWQVVINKN